jgi:hypothetical protein
MRKTAILSEPGKNLVLTSFNVSRDWAFPKRFQPADYLGMSLCQRLHGKGRPDSLLIWWEDRECYSPYWSDRLAKDLGIAATPAFQGDVIERRPKERKWWNAPEKFLPWGLTFVASLAALVGNFSQLESYGSWLLANPEGEISVSALPLRCVQKEERIVEFKVHNRGTGTATLTELKAAANPTDILIVEPRLGPLAPLQSGELRTVICQIVPNTRGLHKITFSGELRSGRVPGRAPLRAAVQELDVWPAFDEAPQITLQHGSGREANFLVEARHGKPPTKTVRYQATGPEELTFIAVNHGQVKKRSNQGEGAAAIVWEKETIPLVREIMTLFVRSEKECSNEEWKRYETRIQVNAEPRFESEDN